MCSTMKKNRPRDFCSFRSACNCVHFGRLCVCVPVFLNFYFKVLDDLPISNQQETSNNNNLFTFVFRFIVEKSQGENSLKVKVCSLSRPRQWCDRIVHMHTWPPERKQIYSWKWFGLFHLVFSSHFDLFLSFWNFHASVAAASVLIIYQGDHCGMAWILWNFNFSHFKYIAGKRLVY